MKTENSFNNIIISDRLDETIDDAIKKARLYRRRKKISKLAVGLASTAAVVLIFGTYKFSIPKTANGKDSKGQVAIKSEEKKLSMAGSEKSASGTAAKDFLDAYGIKDKGIKNAVKNGFIENINQSKTDKGVSFAIDDVINDGRRIVILYSLKLENRNSIVSDLQINRLKITDNNKDILADYNFDPQDGQYSPNDIGTKNYSAGEVDSSTGWLAKLWAPDGRDTNILNSKEIHGFIDITNPFEEKNISKEIHVELTKLSEILPGKINGSNEKVLVLEGHWNINLSLKEVNNKYSPKVYNNIKCSSPEGEFIVDKAKAYPNIVNIKIPTANWKNTDYKYYLQDKKGEKYSEVYSQEKNGEVYKGFESVYFNDPKELKLVIEKIQAGASISAENIVPERLR